MRFIDPSLIYLSDVHLKSPDDERARLLLQCLGHLQSSGLEVLVLGGDVFDFCFGASEFFRDKFRDFQRVLEDLSRSGTRVVFLQGNHEFSLAELGWQGVEFVTSHHTTISLSCGTSFGLAHGDQFLADWSYRAYLALTRSRPWQFFARLIPQKRLDDFALKCSGLSRDRGEYRDLDCQRVIDAATTWIESIPVEHGIFGHFHVPFCWKRSQQPGTLLSVESWSRPNLLIYTGKSFYRAYPEAGASQLVLHQVEEKTDL